MNKKIINPRGGMTLVEVVVAMSIIAVCAAMLWTGYRATSAVMRHSANRSRAANAAFARTQTVGADTESGSVTFRAGGMFYAVEGRFSRGEDGEFIFRAFTPDGEVP